jgi:hypothetical protein
MQYACEILAMHTELWSENLKGREHLEHLGLDNRIIIINLKERPWDL